MLLYNPNFNYGIICVKILDYIRISIITVLFKDINNYLFDTIILYTKLIKGIIFCYKLIK